MPAPSDAEKIKLYGTLLGLSKHDCDDMASGGSPAARRRCARDLKRRYLRENALNEPERRPGLEQLDFWRDTQPTARLVYFIQEGRIGPVKIGISGDPRKRLRDLQTGNPNELRVRNVVPGDPVLEQHLHHRFRDARIRGEWFGRAYLKVILLYAEGLAARGIECYEADHSPPVILGGRHVMSMRRRAEMQRDLQRLIIRYGSEKLWSDRSELHDIMRDTWGLTPEEVALEVDILYRRRRGRLAFPAGDENWPLPTELAA